MTKILTILLIPCFCFALSLDEVKEGVREKLRPYLSKELIVKIFGEKKKEYNRFALPKIPKKEMNALDSSVFKKNKVELKRTKFDELTVEEKRKYRYVFLKELYQVTINEKISQQNLMTYINRLEQGAKREGIYRSLVLSDNYAQLENLPSVISKELAEFVVSYSKKYLNKNFKQEAIRSLNKYSIKRILTEKSLEVVDLLSAEPEDLYQWYAIFSQELSRYTFWRNKARMNPAASFHYAWAKASPLQHIKSELIIKLHKLANYLK